MDVVDKCVKLRALARGSRNAHEAVSAMGRLHWLMTLNGLGDADLDDLQVVTVRFDEATTFSRRSLALAVAVSRGCEVAATAVGIDVVGPRGAVRSAEAIYGLVVYESTRAAVPRHLATELAKKGDAAFAVGQAVCREYFELGLFDALQSKLAPTSKTRAARDFLFAGIRDGDLVEVGRESRVNDSIDGYVRELVKDQKIVDEALAVDQRGAELIATVAPADRSREYAAELRNWATARGREAGQRLFLPPWSPPVRRALVKAQLIAADPDVIAERERAFIEEMAHQEKLRSYAHEIDLGLE